MWDPVKSPLSKGRLFGEVALKCLMQEPEAIAVTELLVKKEASKSRVRRSVTRCALS
jgi:hypothetical protein